MHMYMCLFVLMCLFRIQANKGELEALGFDEIQRMLREGDNELDLMEGAHREVVCTGMEYDDFHFHFFL